MNLNKLVLTPEQRKQIWNREFSPSGGMWGMDEITEAIATHQLKAVSDYLASLTSKEEREEVAEWIFHKEQRLLPIRDRVLSKWSELKNKDEWLKQADSILALLAVKRAKEYRPIDWPEISINCSEGKAGLYRMGVYAGYNQALSDLKAKYPQGLYYKEG
jgi:hypothetical protein